VTPEGPHVWIALPLILLVPMAMAGLMSINAGLTRSRSTAHILLASVCAVSVAMLVYVVIGCSFAGAGSAGHAISIAGRDWNWIGNGRLFARGINFDEPGSVAVLLQLFSVGLAALIPVASGAERWRITAVCASTALLAGITYPFFAHWASAQGWLGQLGFTDIGGAASIQALGGANALCIAWIAGPRHGKFTAEGIPTAMPGHNATLVLCGCMLALVGWLGLNIGGAALAAPGHAGVLVLAAINTVLAAAAGAIAALVGTRVRFGKPDASLTANGWVAGLVAISASAPYVKPAAAMAIGSVVGGAIVFAIEVLEVRMHVDDPAGAISVHGVGGLWGILAMSMLGDAGHNGQFLAQLLGVATLIGIVLPISYLLNAVLNRFVPQRVEISGERQGMDLFELGAGAYPEFMTHREDFMRR
jgi:Amt family ammonium transporter